MDSAIPADLLEVKARFEAWRTNRKYVREPIPDELYQAALKMSRRYMPSLVCRVLKLNPSKLKKSMAKRSVIATRRKPSISFFHLPTDISLPATKSLSLPSGTGYRLQLERPDGSRLTLTLPELDLASIDRICSDFLKP